MSSVFAKDGSILAVMLDDQYILEKVLRWIEFDYDTFGLRLCFSVLSISHNLFRLINGDRAYQA